MSIPGEVRGASALAFGAAAVAAGAVVAFGLCLAHVGTAAAALIGQPGGGSEAVQAVDHIRSDLRYQLVVAALTVVLMTAFGIAVRAPRGWVRGTVWTTTGLLFLAWSCGLVQSTEVQTERGSPAFPDLQAAYRGLLPGWYAGVTGLAVGAMLLLFAALAVSLIRNGAAEFYQSGRAGGAEPPGGYAYLRVPPRTDD